MPRKYLWISSLMVATLVAACLGWNRYVAPSSMHSSAKPSASQAPLPISVVRPHLERADARIAHSLNDGFPAIAAVFKRASKNVEPFANTALGFGSKWRLIADAMPYSNGENHERYLREQFEKMLFSPEELETAVRQSITNFLQETQSIESKMLVDIQADIANFPDTFPIATLDREALEGRFEAALEDAMQLVGSDLRANIGTQVASIVAGEVLTQVAVRLGVSAGILGTGAASGWATLGVGVVVGLIVDQLVNWIWDQWANPRENLAIHIQHHLDVLQSMICNGDEEVQGLKRQLQEVASVRSEARRQAVLSLLENKIPQSKPKSSP